MTQLANAPASRGFVIVNGVITGLNSQRTGTPDSKIGRSLGSTPLRPERSTNISAGFTFNSGGFSLTADFYQIKLRDRISQTGNLSGAGVNAILLANGLEPNQLVSYVTNAIDTRTRGFDVIAERRFQLAPSASVRLSAAFNYNESKITRIKANPPQLAGLNLTLFDRVQQGFLTVGDPKTKIVLDSNWSLGSFVVIARGFRYGAVVLRTTNPATDQHYSAKWIADFELGYKLNPETTVAVGANNLFNTYPDRSTIPDTSGQQLYAQNSPFGFYGGFYYARIASRF